MADEANEVPQEENVAPDEPPQEEEEPQIQKETEKETGEVTEKETEKEPEKEMEKKPSKEQVHAEEPKKQISSASQEEKKSISSKGKLSTKSAESVDRDKAADSIGNLIPRSSEDEEQAKLDKLSSRAKMVLGSVIDIKSQITAEAAGITRTAKYANTYRLESHKPFNHEQVNKVLTTTLLEILEGLTYNAAKCATQVKVATKVMRSKIKEFEYDRYKIVCACTIGEKNSQHFLSTMRFLWDLEKDNYTTCVMENPHVFVIGYCFGIYYE